MTTYTDPLTAALNTVLGAGWDAALTAAEYADWQAAQDADALHCMALEAAADALPNIAGGEPQAARNRAYSTAYQARVRADATAARYGPDELERRAGDPRWAPYR